MMFFLSLVGGGLSNTPPAYHNIPKSQNIFYNPMMIKNNESVCPSPMIQVPFRMLSREQLPGPQLTSHVINDLHLNKEVNNNDASTSLQSVLYQLQTHFPGQPKNLEELLQRSFSSMPSNSVFQSSFVSG